MDGIHVLWSTPKNGAFFKTKYEFLTAVLSALEWKKFNGKCILFTDIKHIDLFNLVWDEIRELGEPPVNPGVFWAAGKIYAMKKLTAPFCMIDTDFIVWKKMQFDSKLCAIHEEELGEIYPDYPDFFQNKAFSKAVKPVNTAFTYINDENFLKLYTEEAISFMENYTGNADCLKPMIFAEQRMFSMCADRLGIKINILSDINKLFKDGHNGSFTHLWGFKSQLEKDEELKKSFERKLENRIEQEFPDVYQKIKGVT